MNRYADMLLLGVVIFVGWLIFVYSYTTIDLNQAKINLAIYTGFVGLLTIFFQQGGKLY